MTRGSAHHGPSRRQILPVQIICFLGLPIICLTFAVLISAVAHAQPPPPPPTCMRYADANTTAPPLAQRFLADNPGAILSVCTTPSGITFYVSASAIERSALNVCRYRLEQQFPMTGASGQILTGTPPSGAQLDNIYPQEFAVRTTGDCPQRGGAGYVRIFNVADDAFARLLAYWQDISTSNMRFDSAFAQDLCARNDFIRLRQFVFQADPMLRMAGISSDTVNGSTTYRFEFRHFAEIFLVTVALTNGALRITNLESGVS